MPQALPAEASASNLRPFLFFELHLDSGTQYFTDCDREIAWNGHTYEPFPLAMGKTDKTAKGETDRVTISLSNVSREIAALLLSEPFRGKRVVIRRFYLSDDYTISSPFTIFEGLLDEVSGEEGTDSSVINATVTTDLAFWQRPIPGRIYQATCAWVFKGTECAYAGAATSCAHTPDACKALNNFPNYGGFRHLPQLETAEIWWGRAGMFRL
jgi:phage-related protein